MGSSQYNQNSLLYQECNRKLGEIQERLNRSLENLRRAHGIAKIETWKIDFPSNHFFCIEYCDDVFGFIKQEPISIESFLSIIHPEDRMLFEEKLEQYRRKGEPFEYEHRIIVNGKYKWVRDRAEPEHDRNGTCIGFFGTTLDISQWKETMEVLRQSEERYRLLFSNMNEGFVYGKAIPENSPYTDFEILDINGTLASMSGKKPEEIIGKTARTLYPQLQDDLDFWRQIIKNTVDSRKPERIETHIPQLKRWFILSIYATAGNHIAVILEDVTKFKEEEEHLKRDKEQTKQLNRDLLRRNEELARLNLDIDSFNYAVSHDLRAPLRSIQGFSQAIQEDYSDKLDKEGKNYFQRIIESTNKMDTFIDALLRLSRQTRGEVHREQIDLKPITDIIMRDLRESDPARKVIWSFHPSCPVYADREMVEVVLTNLLRNAWKFTKTRPVAHIELSCKEEKGSSIFYVKDNGVGFDMAYVDKLFVPFQRLHNEKEFPGIGVGLATVKRIIEKNGGRVWAEGEPDKGATFYFTLPQHG